MRKGLPTTYWLSHNGVIREFFMGNHYSEIMISFFGKSFF